MEDIPGSVLVGENRQRSREGGAGGATSATPPSSPDSACPADKDGAVLPLPLALCTNHVEARVAHQIFSDGLTVFTRCDEDNNNSSPPAERSPDETMPPLSSSSEQPYKHQKDDSNNTKGERAGADDGVDTSPGAARPPQEPHESSPPPPRQEEQQQQQQQQLGEEKWAAAPHVVVSSSSPPVVAVTFPPVAADEAETTLKAASSAPCDVGVVAAVAIRAAVVEVIDAVEAAAAAAGSATPEGDDAASDGGMGAQGSDAELLPIHAEEAPKPATEPATEEATEGAPPVGGASAASSSSSSKKDEQRDAKAPRPPRGKRLRNELMDSSGFACQWRQICRDASDGPAGSAARALGLSMLAQSSVRGVTRRASRVAGEACVAAELQSNPIAASLAASNPNAVERPHAAEHSLLDLGGGVDASGLASALASGRHSAADSGLLELDGAVKGAKGAAALPPSLRGGAAGPLSASSVGALASGILARLHFDAHERKEVPLGPSYQVEVPEYEGPWVAAAERAAAEVGAVAAEAGSAVEAATAAEAAEEAEERRQFVATRDVEIEAARSTAARLTAAAYGPEAELGATLGWAPREADAQPPAGADPAAALRGGGGGAGSSSLGGRSASSASLEGTIGGGEGGDGEVHACDYCGKVLAKSGALTMHTRFCKARLSGAPPRSAMGSGGGRPAPASRNSSQTSLSNAVAASKPAAPASLATDAVAQRAAQAAAAVLASGGRQAAAQAAARLAGGGRSLEGRGEGADGERMPRRVSDGQDAIKIEGGEHGTMYGCPACGKQYVSIASVNRHRKISCTAGSAHAEEDGEGGGGAGSGGGDTKRKRSPTEQQPLASGKSSAERRKEEKLLAEPDVFVVEKLLGERYYGSGSRRRKQYLVRWEGYCDAENTWEDVDSILDDDLIDEYRRMKRDKQAAAAEGGTDAGK